MKFFTVLQEKRIISVDLCRFFGTLLEKKKGVGGGERRRKVKTRKKKEGEKRQGRKLSGKSNLIT